MDSGAPIPFTIEGFNDKGKGRCDLCDSEVKPRKYKGRYFHKKIPYIPLSSARSNNNNYSG